MVRCWNKKLIALMGTLLLLAGCQPKVYLMPAPVSLKYENSNYYNLSTDTKDSNLLYTLYATNRIPFNETHNNFGYSIFPSSNLALGYTVHSIGDHGMSWDDTYRQSVNARDESDLLLKQEYYRKRVEYKKNDDHTLQSSEAEGYFDWINSVLERTFDKDIVVYVHGANSNFYRATAQGAQYFHYTGHNSIVLNFSWPSAENILYYKTDVLHAKKTIPVFAKLLEVLAQHTNARNIDILSYSAGAQIVAPSLAYLHDKYPQLTTKELKNKLRIGDIYFAAPDVNFDSFVSWYIKFKDIINRTTISLNKDDSVLRFATFYNGVSRLGRPDLSDLSSEDQAFIIETTQTPQLDIIDIARSKPLGISDEHDYWYSHPWVSNDLLLLMLFNLDPEMRALQDIELDNGAKVYNFPDDYTDKINKVLIEKRDYLLGIKQKKE